MTFFEIVMLPAGAAHIFERIGQKEKMIVGKGRCNISYGSEAIMAEKGANLDLSSEGDHFEVTNALDDTTLIRMCGNWGDEVGGSGLFGVSLSDSPRDNGDPVTYTKQTNFDRHYHDCDEYWIIFEGCGTAVSEGKFHHLEVGDCLATGMGYHHDFPLVEEPVRGVYFETTLEGQKRLGHLWNHTHGEAQPKLERV
jgi:mannose-6-phosphate isomerase-like protein (cupin superfamily)